MPPVFLFGGSQKLDVLAAVQRKYIPYTVIDVGWWSQQIIPKLPSGRVDHAYIDLVRIPPLLWMMEPLLIRLLSVTVIRHPRGRQRAHRLHGPEGHRQVRG